MGSSSSKANMTSGFTVEETKTIQDIKIRDKYAEKTLIKDKVTKMMDNFLETYDEKLFIENALMNYLDTKKNNVVIVMLTNKKVIELSCVESFINDCYYFQEDQFRKFSDASLFKMSKNQMKNKLILNYYTLNPTAVSRIYEIAPGIIKQHNLDNVVCVETTRNTSIFCDNSVIYLTFCPK